jgi:hypothetical protein
MQRYLPTKKSYNVVFDIGKLNAKILLFDEHLNIKKVIKTQYPIIKINKNLKKFYQFVNEDNCNNSS